MELRLGSMTDIRDGQIYRTVSVGDKTWLAQDLAYAGPDGNLGWIYDNSSSLGSVQGRLYDWDSLNQESPFGVCPPGWHLPSKDEWGDLIDSVEGNAMRLKVAETGSSNGYTSGNESIGFGALAPGFRFVDKKFYNFGKACYYWTCTEKFPDYPWAVIMESGVIRQIYCVEVFKRIALSVRCVKD